VKYGTQEDTPDTGLAAEPQWASPPRQLELAPPGTAEFVICDHTIELNFRDAKQYWGLEDFMHVQETAVSNAANFSLFMVNVAHVLVSRFRNGNPQFGVLDLKAYFRGHKYVAETLKLLPQSPEPVLIAEIFDQVSRLGRVHNAEPCLTTS